jgi:hypothetical protein
MLLVAISETWKPAPGCSHQGTGWLLGRGYGAGEHRSAVHVFRCEPQEFQLGTAAIAEDQWPECLCILIWVSPNKNDIYIIYSKPHHQTYDYYGFPMWKYMKCGTNIHDQIVRWSGGYRALFHRWWCPFGDESCLNTSMGQRPQTWTFGCDWFFWTNLENLREDKNPQLGIVVSGRIDNLLKLMISHDFKWFHSSSIKADLTNLNSTVLLNHLTTWFSKWIEKWLTMINHD